MTDHCSFHRNKFNYFTCHTVFYAGSNVQVLGVHVAKTTARMALEGEYTKARTKALVNQRLVQRVG